MLDKIYMSITNIYWVIGLLNAGYYRLAYHEIKKLRAYETYILAKRLELIREGGKVRWKKKVWKGWECERCYVVVKEIYDKGGL